jgi:hypothetical protein
MPIQADWDDQLQHTYYYKFQPGWTWDDFFRATDVEHERGKALGEARYDVIGDFLEAPNLPSGLAISAVARTMRSSPKNRGLVVVITHNRFITVMVSTGSKIYREIGDFFVIAKTVDEARHLIQQARSRGVRTTQEMQPPKP